MIDENPSWRKQSTLDQKDLVTREEVVRLVRGEV